MSQRVLGHASYRVDDTVHSFDSAPAARAAFERALATAKTSKSKKAIDATGPQADRDDGKLVRVWVTVGWTHSKSLDDWAWLASVKTATLHLLGAADARLVASLAKLTPAKISVAPRYDGIRA